ncbi:Stk1 family PASTA domain-containing Ser/Thr kinase [Demequina lutea]|uniref:non-specific serine/threonine protein kinase n=1 Tax=Demequina lutea TaxID=431489 RepID=A0A7Y9Z714_9MICO|nr:Stk1 family PASTA domain-containing Ser/Thr kinase [Demequina lutea]NYI39987.1 serine/threonine-protein kinase [Demequina lutea]
MNDEPRILAGRYEVGDLIGRGGMAEVHIGYDTRLGRSVAIKILRPDLARDPSFQTRFRREAQAAAGLNHPSIVAVYDTGEDQFQNDHGVLQAVPFIVMEYVEGHTVRDILKGDVAAPIEEAVEITEGVLAGLDYAHHAGLVHRDIKPANVMLTPTGAVKVMDFGIARALADVGQTMTQTQAVVGTAQYLSPEQARGENVDARSDLYSTGCLLFELLTGRPPFMGDSPVSVAYQHVREPAPRPSQFASDVPPELDAVVAKALEKDRNLRYSTAQEFTADLQRAMGVTPSPTSGVHAVGAVGAVGVAAAAGVPRPDAPAGAGPGPGNASPYAPGFQPGAAGQGGPGTGATTVMPAATAGAWGSVMGGSSMPPRAPSPATGTLIADEYLVEDDPRHRRLMIQIAIGAAAVIALIILVVTLFSIANRNSNNAPPAPTLVTIPIVTNALQADAESRLTKLDLVVDVQQEASATVAVGRVTRTDPASGQQVAAKSTVTMWVSTGPDTVTIPDVKGLTQADAITALEAAGVKVSDVQTEHDPTIVKDRATRTDPASTQSVARDSSVTLYVSDGLVDLPELRTQTSTEAQQTLIKLGLVADLQNVATDQQDPNTVYDMTPKPGPVPQGSTVTLQIATAPTTVAVPDVVGKTQANATSILQAAGLNVTVTKEFSTAVPPVPIGNVISQNPSAGIQVALNTTVTLTVSKGPGVGPTPTATATATKP